MKTQVHYSFSFSLSLSHTNFLKQKQYYFSIFNKYSRCYDAKYKTTNLNAYLMN